MPYITNHGVRIYYEVEGDGPPIVLVAGLTRNLQTWRLYGYVTALKSDYQLILVDPRGHGNSEKPHDVNAYTPERMTGDVVAVLDDGGIAQAYYWGYSMGGSIGYQLAHHHPSRFSAYIIGGQAPYRSQSSGEEQLETTAQTMFRLGREEGPEAVIRFLEQWLGRPYLPEEKERIRRNDYTALSILWQQLHSSSEWDAPRDLLPRITVPCLLYAGDQDPTYAGVKDAATHISNAQFITLSGLRHSPAYNQSEYILPQVQQFLSRITK